MSPSIVPAHDIAIAGPPMDQSSPTPGLTKRSSTIRSQSSGRSSFSLTIKAKAHGVCPECNASSLGLQSFHFSRSNSTRNPLQCSTCKFIMMYIGGSPPASRSQTFNVVADSSPMRKSSSIPALNHQPSVRSGLAISRIAALSVAGPSPDIPGSNGVQTRDFEAKAAVSKDSTDEDGKEGTEIVSAEDAPTDYQEVKERSKILRKLLPQFLSRNKMRQFVIKKLKVTAADLEAINISPAPRAPETPQWQPPALSGSRNAVHERTGGYRPSVDSMQARHPESVSELDHEAEEAIISARMGIHNEPRRSQDKPSPSSLLHRHRDYIGGVWSQYGGSESSLARLRRQNGNRDSYGSNLSSEERSDIQPLGRPQPPQAPHATVAAGPGNHAQVANLGVQLEGNPRDSVIEE